MCAALEFGRRKLQAELKCGAILVVKKTRGKRQIKQLIPSGGYS